jgi:hypothetical protein
MSMRTLILPLMMAGFLAACAREEPAPPMIHSHLSGTISVSAEVDSVQDFSGFEVFVINQRESNDPDTLGLGATDSLGAYSLDIAAPERGVYPVVISRRGTLLKMGELAVTDGDTATMRVQFPVGSRPLYVRSPENAGWMAYQNAKAQYNQSLYEQIQKQGYDQENVGRLVEQFSNILWDARSKFPGSVGATVAGAESNVMLEGWNDSLVVQRAAEMEPDKIGLVNIAGTVRRSQARLGGQASALALMRRYQEQMDEPERRAALASEMVLAHLDSVAFDEALAEARQMQQLYAGTRWEGWARRAIYELENLLPGKSAPAFTVQTRDGGSVALDEFRGSLLLVEFYRPGDQAYLRDLGTRNAIYNTLDGRDFEILSISLEPEPLVNDAFFEGRDIPGVHAVAPEGLNDPVAVLYNINEVPTRFLIDPQGIILGKYAGNAFDLLQRDLVAYDRQKRSS